MQIHASPDPHKGEFPVHVNPGSGDPFGVLHLGEDFQLHVETDEDADRIVRAAMRIKAMRAAIGKPHAHAPGAGQHGSHCTVCGMLRDAEDHTAPAPEPSPLQRYDRQRHLTWHEERHPDGDHWPKEPQTDEQAAAYIAQYSAPPCPAVHPDKGTPCTAPMAAHPMPHRDAKGNEWTDGRPASPEGCAARMRGLGCTRAAGHPGRHEAHGPSPLPVWHDGDGDYREDESHECHGEDCFDTGDGAPQCPDGETAPAGES